MEKIASWMEPKEIGPPGILLIIAPYIAVLSLVYSVLGIELTLHWNGVTGVYSVGTTGQLIPLTIGLCGLLQIICLPLFDVRSIHAGCSRLHSSMLTLHL